MTWTEVLYVSARSVDIQEAAGSSENLWLEHGLGETWLFKLNRVQSNGHEQGEDWAELLAHRIAHLLEIPAAVARMGVRREVDGDEGRVCRPALPRRGRSAPSSRSPFDARGTFAGYLVRPHP